MDEQVCGRLAYGGSVVVVLSAYGFFLADHGGFSSPPLACGTLCPRQSNDFCFRRHARSFWIGHLVGLPCGTHRSRRGGGRQCRICYSCPVDLSNPVQEYRLFDGPKAVADLDFLDKPLVSDGICASKNRSGFSMDALGSCHGQSSLVDTVLRMDRCGRGFFVDFVGEFLGLPGMDARPQIFGTIMGARPVVSHLAVGLFPMEVCNLPADWGCGQGRCDTTEHGSLYHQV